MRLAEQVLQALSRSAGSADYDDVVEPATPDNALADLYIVFPDLDHLISEKRVLDFGCGSGRQTLALARSGARLAVGLDTNSRVLESARELAARTPNVDPERVAFTESALPELEASFDVVISKDSMEHFSDPAGTLSTMRRLLKPGGRILISFGPPWYAPYGSHMHFFTRVPWVNLLFSERTVMRVRTRYRDDGAMRYEDVESGLNRMSVGRFEALVRQSGLRIVRQNYRCIKNIPFARVPLIRELFINHVVCILTEPENIHSARA